MKNAINWPGRLWTGWGFCDGNTTRLRNCQAAQQQRVAIARAIVSKPLLLLADEPTGSLDTKRSIEIMQLLKDLNEQDGITVSLVTHEPEMATFAKRIVHFRDGRIESDQGV